MDVKESEYLFEKFKQINERLNLDTILTKPFDLNKKITLFHFSDVLDKNKKVYPLRLTVGNKLSTPHYCSWWAHGTNSALCLGWFVKQNFGKEAAKENLLNDINKTGSMVWMDKDFYEKNKDVLKNVFCYKYTKTFKIGELGRGQEYAVEEWTYDKEVVADKVEKYTWNKMIENGDVRFCNKQELIEKRKVVAEKTKNTNYICYLRNKPWIYFDYLKTKEKSKDIRDKENYINPKYKYLLEEYNVPEQLDEKIETLLARPKDFFNKEIHLYRGGDKIVDYIEPTFLNYGTYLSKPRDSSFWSDDYNTAVNYAMKINLTNNEINDLYSIPMEDVPELMKNIDLYELFNKAQWAKGKIGLNFRVCPIDDKKYIFCTNNHSKEEFIKKLKKIKLDSYIYEVTISGNDKDLGIGWNKGVREFTIDRPIKPDKIEHLTQIPDKFIDSMVFIYDPKEYIELSKKSYNEKVKRNGAMEALLKTKMTGKYNSLDSIKSLKNKIFQSTDFFKKEFIKKVNDGYTDIVIIADSHLGKHQTIDEATKSAEELGKDTNKLFKSREGYLLLLGDIVDKSVNDEDRKKIINIFSNQIYKTCKILYMYGNSEDEIDPKKDMLNDNTDIKWCGYKIETNKYIFTHAPVSITGDKINIHAHLHGINTYWGIEPKNHIDVWRAGPHGIPVTFNDILDLGDNPYAVKVETPKDIDLPMKHLFRKYLTEEANDLFEKYEEIKKNDNEK